MEVGELLTVAIEWHHWQPKYDLEPKLRKAKVEPNLKCLMGLDGFFQAQCKADKSATHERVAEFVNEGKAVSYNKAIGNYHFCTPQQIQEFLDLIIEQGMSVRQSGLSVDIAVRTAQYYVKLCRNSEKKRSLGGVNKKLALQHKALLIGLYK
ncbi:hypothetical protein A0J61_05982 [Choanephora cucurbitarum]|uniref:Uncharacterized protein n=1 Tax=Choanephora cucurbitarum TaxID=101091 RepID=A0A1C7NB32_9FUNG|nr:hypothetical protein A0J61_05982 [Choanephora cucurbitarum]